MAGKIEVIAGCMFSGKSDELIRRIDRERIAKKETGAFTYYNDDRYGRGVIASHSGAKIPALPVPNSARILEIFRADALKRAVVAIDEAQFFDDGLPEVVRELADEGLRVIVAGLDKDFARRPFGPVGQLLVLADEVVKLSAICTICGGPAYFTQRLANGKPAHIDDPVVIIGAQDKYEARCRIHHIYLTGPREADA